MKAAQAMIDADDRSQGEFYVAPAYNYMINDGARIRVHDVGDEGRVMHGLGTPDDLRTFIEASIR